MYGLKVPHISVSEEINKDYSINIEVTFCAVFK